MIRSAAVIGLGAMGAPMARRLQGAGFELIVCDRNAVVTAAFAKAGARVAPTPADCAEADFIALIVATPGQVRDVVLGPGGILADALASGRSPIVAVMSTVPAEDLKDLALQLQPSGIRLIDAPVSGGVVGAEEGSLTIMTGGDPQDIEAAAPAFTAMGSQHFHCGSLGAAQMMKIVNNTICIANAVISAEAYQLAVEHGLDIATVARVLDVSTGRNYLSKAPGALEAMYATMVPDRAGYASLLAILRKDMHMACDLVAGINEGFPAMQQLGRVVDGLGDETFARWRRLAGLPDGA